MIAAGFVLVTILVSASLLWPGVMVPVLLSIAVTALVIVFIAVRRWTRYSNTQITNLSRRVNAIHETETAAGEQTQKRIQAIQRAVYLTTEKGPAVKPIRTLPNAWRQHPLAQDFVATGTFSAPFYQRVIGKDFTSPEEAAAHYLTFNMQRLLPPNPFVDVSRFMPPVKEAMEKAEALPFINYMGSPRSLRFGPSFDPNYVTVPKDSTLSPLGHFLTSLDDAAMLPVSSGSELSGVRAKEYSEAVTVHLTRIEYERSLRAPREQAQWDTGTETAWKEAQLSTAQHGSPLVSIIMPVKDREELVVTALESVRSQTYDNWELHVVDDHSGDGTFAVLEKIAAEDSRIKVMKNPGAGVSAARNAGVHDARGEYVAFLDSDNRWMPDYLTYMVRVMKRDGIRWAYSASKLLRGEGRPPVYLAFEGGREHLLYRNHIDMNVTMMTAELLRQTGGFDESLKRWVDYDLIVRMTEHAEPVLLPFIGCEYDHDLDRKDRITVKESSHWRWVVFGKGLVDWEAARQAARVPGRVSVVIRTWGDRETTLETVNSFQRNAGVADLEVVVVDCGSDDHDARVLAQNLSCRKGVQYVRLVRPYTPAIANNYGIVHSTGEYILFANVFGRIRDGSLQNLVDELKDESVAGVQPLILKENDTILSAGKAWAAKNSLPVDFLADHPREDASGVDAYRFSAVSGRSLLMRASDLIELHGCDTSFVNSLADVDLSLRALSLRSGGFRVVRSTSIRVISEKTAAANKVDISDDQRLLERWRHSLPGPDTALFGRCGFEIKGIGLAYRDSIGTQTRVSLARPSGSPRRWGIKNPAGPGTSGDKWGDSHFIESLAASLRRLDQEVVTYRRGAHFSAGTIYDDVTLVVRGIHPSAPIPGKVNIMWIISHPDKVSVAELEEYDLVFAASTSWARWATEEFGVTVHPLLQATDQDRFHYQPPTENPSADVVFVGGNYTNRDRKAVLDAAESGVDLKVYGPRWQGALPEEVLAGQYVDNERVADVYRDARFVLAEHWDLMAREGFIQNRIFDAVASGCRVITDEVKDLHETFGDEVLVARGPEDIQRYVQEARDADTEYSTARRATAAQNVLDHHTFDARAEELLSAVEKLEQ